MDQDFFWGAVYCQLGEFIDLLTNFVTYEYLQVRQQDDQEAGAAGKVAVMKEPRSRADTLPPQHPICTLTIALPDYTGPLPTITATGSDAQKGAGAPAPLNARYAEALGVNAVDAYPDLPIELVARRIGGDWYV